MRYGDVIKSAGLYGFGGNCGWVAIKINDVVFGGTGTLVAALNRFLLQRHGRWVGHVAVLHDGHYYDAEGEKPEELILSWGMLDPQDQDYFTPEEIQQHGEGIAYEVDLYEVTPEEVIEKLDGARFANPDEIETKLRHAMQHHSAQYIRYRNALYRRADAAEFSGGYCTEFAAALHRRFGYVIKVMYDAQWDDYDEAYTNLVMVHVYCLVRPGVAVDAQGIRPEKQLLAEVKQDNPGVRLKTSSASLQDLDALSMEGLAPEVMQDAEQYVEEHVDRYAG